MYTLWFPFVITPRHGWEFDSLEEAIASGKDAGFTFYVMAKVTDSRGTHNYKAASWCPIRGLRRKS